jgi:hypothetical protein
MKIGIFWHACFTLVATAILLALVWLACAALAQ